MQDGARRRTLVRQLWNASPLALAALPVGAAILYAKVRALQLGGLRTTARLAERSVDSLGVLERLSLLRGDLIVVFIAVPLLTWLLAVIAGRRRRVLVISVALFFLMAAFYVQLRAFAATGSYVHLDMLRSAVGFGLDRPDMIGRYLSFGGLLKAVFAIIASMALAVLMDRYAVRREPSGPGRRARSLAIGALALVVMVVGLASIKSLPTSAFSRSVLLAALAAYADDSRSISLEMARLSDAQLRSRYRQLAGIPPSSIDSAYFGRARGFNLVRMIMETVPASCLDVEGPLTDYPSMSRLRQQAFVSGRHFTTFPNSSLSNFSGMSGWYPAPFGRPNLKGTAGRLPSIVWPLRSVGYQVALYEPFEARFEDDTKLYQMFGVQRQVRGGAPRFGAGPSWTEIAHADSIALQAMLGDIDRWAAASTSFVAIFKPQISHAPWNDPVAGRQAASLLERCRALVAVQDGWLGDILRTLEKHHQLDSTVILLTADHGIRTSVEDPAFHTGFLSEYSFRVPLMLYVPQVLRSPVVLGAVSSNIDIAPTLRDLFGVERDRAAEQGNAFWDPQLSARRTFFLAGAYSGADGYHENGHFVAWNPNSGVTCRSSAVMRCDAGDVLGVHAPAHDSIHARIHEFLTLQSVWVQRFVENAPGVR